MLTATTITVPEISFQRMSDGEGFILDTFLSSLSLLCDIAVGMSSKEKRKTTPDIDNHSSQPEGISESAMR